MEEDIKILEDMITWDCTEPNKRQTEALENLIKGYRELEENLKIATAMLTKGQYPEKNKGDNDFSKHYIPKSKIKEKIEEINSELEEKYSAEKISVFSGNTYMEKFKLLGKLQELQELMEDK